MIKMMVVLWILAVTLYIFVKAFNKSQNKQKILKQVAIAVGFLTVAALILTAITILF
jgi:hypothetical protein